MFNLDGKTALVTGATGGLGQAIAKSLHAQGATVILTGRRQEVLQELASELGERAHVLVSDLSDKEQTSELFAKAEELAGQVDIVICNAGITQDNLTLRMKDDEWQNVLDTNLSSTFVLNKTALKKMFKRRWGRIINITSVVGVTGNPGQANYAASKAGMIGMSKSIAQEAASRGITINCIAPGFIKTAMTDALNDDQKSAITANIPSGELGKPEDIASAVVYLASNEAAYVTGQTLHVNGGMVMV
tara:strand:+ start:46 stop:783 length:738 start_codon:yes stop_codon:yes gene_type:complete